MQGFNRYYPPDYDGKSSLNKIAGKHALGDRARKLDKGILIVRFELPFNIWCGTCNAHIGMGVRYNAEKKKIGNYHSTPIYSFRCKCHLCAGYFEVQTDPKNTRYVVTEGAKQQASDWDPEENGGHPVSYTDATEAEKEGNAFEKFEKDTTSKKRALTAAERLDELEELSEDRWSDPYALNKRLRKALREDKGKRRENVHQDDELLARYGLGDSVRLDLVRHDDAKVEGDSTAAWLSKSDKNEVRTSAEASSEWDLAQIKRRKIEFSQTDRKALLAAETGWKETPLRKPESSRALVSVSKSTSSSSAVSKLKSQLRMNSVRKSDPFLSPLSAGSSSSGLAGVLIKGSRK